VVVFLLLGVIWAAVLVPPWLQSRREARPIASIMSFRSQLWSLERATPTYGADTYGTYGTYGDDAYHDDLSDDDTGAVAEVHALTPDRRPEAVSAIAPGVIGAVVRGPSEGMAAGVTSAPAAAVLHRRALAYRRRRQVLAALVLVAAAGVAPALLLGGPWIVAEAVASTLLVAYLGLLVRRGRHEAERVQKVRYLTPIRAPRPSVVIIGSGAAR
jgi:hypothetical protein